MINDYAGLQDAIYKWMLKDISDLVVTATQVQNYISLCEAELNRELRIRDLQKSALLSVTPTGIVPLPSDFREPITLQFSDMLFEPMYMTRDDLKGYNNANGPGRPGAYTFFGSNIIFSTTDSTYPLTLDYYANITPLSPTQTTNIILQKHPDVYLYGAMRQALLQLQDQQKLTNVDTNYTQIVQRIRNDDMNSKIPSGTAIRPRGRSIG